MTTCAFQPNDKVLCVSDPSDLSLLQVVGDTIRKGMIYNVERVMSRNINDGTYFYVRLTGSTRIGRLLHDEVGWPTFYFKLVNR